MSEPMREHTTFKIGGPADVFVTPDTEQGLVATLDTCYRCDLPLTIVGNGSDLLVGDKGIRGVVVALSKGLSDITVDGTHVTAAAGACFPMSPRRQPRPAYRHGAHLGHPRIGRRRLP
ncbi:MAG: FAD-binding protein [Collinsella sp.]